MTTQFIPRPVHLMLIWDLSAGPARNPKAVPEPVLPGEILDYLSKGKKDLQYAEYSEAALRRLAGLALDSRLETFKDVIARLLRHLIAYCRANSKQDTHLWTEEIADFRKRSEQFHGYYRTLLSPDTSAYRHNLPGLQRGTSSQPSNSNLGMRFAICFQRSRAVRNHQKDVAGIMGIIECSEAEQESFGETKLRLRFVSDFAGSSRLCPLGRI
eukprot:TRINITY_DN3240_c0_g1_i7.p1 TRINITY_DN3240_c0_g1~~TRINITY_DN3240_c0_g1_i7.p1  ORF type:complete len:213 (+),score=25.26 TRINITY_DN3240_c0_g1_i7:238-876(+)